MCSPGQITNASSSVDEPVRAVRSLKKKTTLSLSAIWHEVWAYLLHCRQVRERDQARCIEGEAVRDLEAQGRVTELLWKRS